MRIFKYFGLLGLLSLLGIVAAGVLTTHTAYAASFQYSATGSCPPAFPINAGVVQTKPARVIMCVRSTSGSGAPHLNCRPPLVQANNNGTATCVRAGTIKVWKKQRAIDNNTEQAGDTPPGPSSTTSDTQSTNTPVVSKRMAPTPDPEGDIFVTTYVNLPGEKGKDNTKKDRTIGRVKVKVERVGGDQKCDNRTKEIGTTNQTTSIQRKGSDGKKHTVPVKGTLHYYACNTGDYKVTLIGRKGYHAVGKSVKNYHLDKNETLRPSFVIEKDVATKTNGANGGGSSTGGTAAQ